MHYFYGLLPLVAWFVAGTTKFIFNYLRFGKEAVARVGNGGFPSTHTTVISSAVALVGFKLGFDSPISALAVAILVITVIDAMGIRRAVGRQAAAINQMTEMKFNLRESQGHKPIEVLAGLILGTIIAYAAIMME
jgi:uncharacterized protein